MRIIKQKVTMKLNNLFVVVLCTILIGCSGGPSQECKRVKELVSHKISVGSSEESVLAFYKSQQWELHVLHFENLGYLYSHTFFDKTDDKHSVLVEIWVSEEKKIKSYRVFDAYTSL